MRPETVAAIDRRRSVVERLKRVLIENLNLDLSPDEIDEDAALFGVGMELDSIDALQLVLGVEKEFKSSIPTDDLMIYRSLNTLADFLIGHGVGAAGG